MHRRFAFFLLLPCLMVATLAAQSFAGQDAGAALHIHMILLDSNGAPLSGDHWLTFTIRNAQREDGAVLWRETRPVASDAAGRYTVELAAGAPDRLREELHATRLLRVTASGSSWTRTSEAVITNVAQGVWVDCNPDNTSCEGNAQPTSEAELQTLAAAHFRTVANDSNLWGSEAQMAGWAREADRLGLKIIWYIPSDFALYQGTPVKDYSLMANDTELPSSFCPGCSNAAFTSALITFFQSFPATAGYYIDDETMNIVSQGELANYKGTTVSAAAAESGLKALASTLRAADPHHRIYGAETWDSVNSATEKELAGYLDPIAGDLNVMGADYYPQGTGEAASTEATAVGWLDAIADRYAKETFVNLQAFDWNDFAPGACASAALCVYPTVSELQTMMEGAAGAPTAPVLLLWFDYGDAAQNGQWKNLVWAANPQ
ncbi:MAG TPA: hypothetical protein VHU89_00560 [Acidobacteriaceae bacterium]|nr:hypothetical protein [Acidobacteriaceae bacterium]